MQIDVGIGGIELHRLIQIGLRTFRIPEGEADRSAHAQELGTLRTFDLHLAHLLLGDGHLLFCIGFVVLHAVKLSQVQAQ